MNNIHIILYKPQLPENIGAIARIMKNFGFTSLRIVDPECQWPNTKAVATACTAYNILIHNTNVYDSLSQALADINIVYAASAKSKERTRDVMPAQEMSKVSFNQNMQYALLFGPEKHGFRQQELMLANHIIYIETHTDCTSLNLAQAAAILCYETSKNNTLIKRLSTNPQNEDPASKEDIYNIYKNTMTNITAANSLRNDHKIEKLSRDFVNIISRAQLCKKDVRIIHGILKALQSNGKSYY